MKINGFGMSRTNETLRKDQDKQTKEKNSTTKPQEKADTYSISPEAKAKMEEVAKQQEKVGEKPEEPQQGKGKINNHVSELRSASEDGMVLTEEQISACSSGVEEVSLITTTPTYVEQPDEYGVLGPKQDIEGSFTGEYEYNSAETTIPETERLGFYVIETVEDFDTFMSYNLTAREQITNAINQALSENGIVIPEGVEFDISVDPYNFDIHVTGVNGQTLDPELEKQIELALNKGDNGRNLYSHICAVNQTFVLSDPDSVEFGGQFEKSYLTDQFDAWRNAYYESTWKTYAVGFIEDYTGYDFDELEYRDGTWYTPDGDHAWSTAQSNFLDTVPQGEKSAAIMAISGIAKGYQSIYQNGYDNVDDRNMTITYSGGALYDYGSAQGLGEGQTDWVEEVRTEIGKFEEKMIVYDEACAAHKAQLDANKVQPEWHDWDMDDFEAMAREKLLEHLDMQFGLFATGVSSIEELLAQINDKYASYYTLLDTLLGNDD
ncbi:MAG: DUF4885 family protein [Eubacteriales bacterium]